MHASRKCLLFLWRCITEGLPQNSADDNLGGFEGLILYTEVLIVGGGFLRFKDLYHQFCNVQTIILVHRLQTQQQGLD